MHPRRPAALDRILQRTAETGFPMASEEQTGCLLRTLAASKAAGQFLELGTGTGVATAWLLDGMDAQSTLISVDIDAGFQRIAREELGGDARLHLVTEDAAAFLRRQAFRSFDFIFADAMPGKYEWLEDALRIVRCGGFYVIDDMLPQANWPEGHAPRAAALADHLRRHPDFLVTELSWASGCMIAVRKCANHGPG